MWRLTENEGTFDMDVEIEESCKKEWDMFADRVHKFIAVMHSELGLFYEIHILLGDIHFFIANSGSFGVLTYLGMKANLA